MKCIVGLGNPGRKYQKTRHNIGFQVVDKLAERNNWKLDKKKFNGRYGLENSQKEKIILLKPQTYMNLSGESLRPLMDYYEIEPEEVVVIYDDLDLPVGKIRLRQKGGHGGHNGIRSVMDQLGTKEFNRIRVGIGRPVAPVPVIDHVLSRFSKEEKQVVSESISQAAAACEAWLSRPFAEVMNEFNQ